MATAGSCEVYTRPPTPSGWTPCRVRSTCTGQDLTGDFDCWNQTQVLYEQKEAGKCGSCGPSLNVTSVTARQVAQGNLPPGYYSVEVAVSYTGSGMFRVLVNGGEVHRETVSSSGTKTYIWGLTAGSHIICAEAV